MHPHRLRAFTHSSSLRSAAGIAAAGAAGAAIVHNRDRLLDLRLLNSTVIEAVSGAAGEVAQIALVYPLDTIKVRCQAAGLNSRQVWASMRAATGGDAAALLAALYAGAVPAALLSIIVGSVHYCCFCATRRALVGLSGARGDGAAEGGGGSGEHLIVSHGATGSHYLPIDDGEQPGAAEAAAAGQQAGAGRRAKAHSKGAQHTAAVAAEALALAQGGGGGGGSNGGGAAHQHAGGEGSLGVNVASAVITAALTALVEAPLELFRHNSQAGHIQGSFLGEMWRVLRKSGPRSLYFGLVPYCFESWPYDISELLVVGAAKDLRHSPTARAVAPAAFDLAVGGLAGTTAVLVSMPFDVIKTYLQTNGAPAGVERSAGARAFWATGRALIAKGGPGALFVGLAPRLAHQVPGACVCWLVIESVHRRLTDAAAAAGGGGTGGAEAARR